MARIRYASLVQDISGSVGSSTFQKNLYGNTLRSRPRAQKTGSQAQLLQRTYLIQAQNAWKDLSELQRKQWNDYISFSGSSIKKDRNVLTTGHALFIKYHVFRFMTGLPVLGDLYYQSMPAHPSFSDILCSPPESLLLFDTAVDPSICRFIFRIGPSCRNTGAFNPRGLRFMNLTWFESNNLYFEVPYIAAFGNYLLEGYAVNFSIQWFSCLAPIIEKAQFYNRVTGYF